MKSLKKRKRKLIKLEGGGIFTSGFKPQSIVTGVSLSSAETEKFNNDIAKRFVKKDLPNKSLGARKGGGASFGQIAEQVAQFGGAIGSALGGDKYEKTSLTKGADQAFDAASSAVMMVNPLIGGIMKTGGFISDAILSPLGLTKANGSTMDQIASSKLMSLLPSSIINSAFAKKIKTQVRTNEDIAKSSSYGGVKNEMQKAAANSDKQYGAVWGNRARRKAERQARKARQQMYTTTDILNEGKDRRAIVDSSSDMFTQRNAINQAGGYKNNIPFGREGFKFITSFRRKYVKGGTFVAPVYKMKEDLINSNVRQNTGSSQVEQRLNNSNTWVEKDPKYIVYKDLSGRELTNIDIVEDMAKYNIPILKAFQELNPDIDLPELLNRIESERLYTTTNLKNIIDPVASQFKSISDSNESKEVLNKYLEEAGFDPTEFWRHKRFADRVNFTNDPTLGANEVDKKSIMIGPRYIARLSGRQSTYNGKTGERVSYTSPYTEYLNLFNELKSKNSVQYNKEGGKFPDKNIIPDGALHARLHNLNIPDITKKGIPVILEKGGQIDQQAEIERGELILRKGVTDKLEELYKLDTDEAAIEAGKLLAKEILHNTIDKTKLIKTVE